MIRNFINELEPFVYAGNVIVFNSNIIKFSYNISKQIANHVFANTTDNCEHENF